MRNIDKGLLTCSEQTFELEFLRGFLMKMLGFEPRRRSAIDRDDA